MKKIILFVLISITLNAQSWNSIVTTGIDASNIEYFENFANKDRIHIAAVDNNQDIDYYLINLQGTVVRSASISTNGEYPNIVGSNNEVYIVYREGSDIKVKKSTDSGQNWASKDSYTIGSNPCSGVDASIYAADIHTVWSIGDQSGDLSETNYARYDIDSEGWYDNYNVTNYSNGYGTSPTVAVSPDRVHVGYNNNDRYDSNDQYYAFDANEMNRTKYNDTWQTQQQIVNEANKGTIIALSSSKLYDFYYDFEGGMGQFRTDLYYKHRDIGSTSWSSSTLLEQASDITVPAAISTVNNGSIHTYTASGVVKERIIVNGSINSTSDISGSGYIGLLNSTSAYDDIYVNWKIGTSDYLKFRQYDVNPQIPQNFSIDFSGTHPVISWNLNKGPDIDSYKILKKIEGETGWGL